MKRLSLPLVLAVIIGFGISCSETKVEPTDQLSDAAKSYLSMYLGGSSRSSSFNSIGPGNPMAESFQRMNALRGSAGGRIAGDTTEGVEPDTVIYDDYQWITCATITTVENADGSTTTTYDYGDGCWEGSAYYKYFMFGKYTYTSRYTQSTNGTVFTDSYLYDSEMDNYGGTFYYDADSSSWLSDGVSHSEGESTYDTVANEYSGHYEYDYDNTYSYDTVTYAYNGSGRSSYDNLRYVVERNDYSYTEGDNYYSVSVIVPMTYEYNCNPYGDDALFLYRCFMMIYTSGREQITYRQNGEEGSFIIDYGNGECDSKITIIENGKTIVIDMLRSIGG